MDNLSALLGNQSIQTAIDNGPSGGGLAHVPDALYKMVIVDASMAPAKSGKGQNLIFKMVITEGQYANTEFTDYTYFRTDGTGEELAKNRAGATKKLALLAKAMSYGSDKPVPTNPNDYKNKPFMVKTKTVEGTEYLANDGTKQMGKAFSNIDDRTFASLAGAMAPVAAAYAAPAAVAADATAAMPWQQ